MKEDKIKICIWLPNGVKHKIELTPALFGRKKMLTYNGKYFGMVSVTKVITRIRKLIVNVDK